MHSAPQSPVPTAHVVTPSALTWERRHGGKQIPHDPILHAEPAPFACPHSRSGTTMADMLKGSMPGLISSTASQGWLVQLNNVAATTRDYVFYTLRLAQAYDDVAGKLA